MEYQSALHKKLHEGGFAFTAETTPPDASNKEVLLEKTNHLSIYYLLELNYNLDSSVYFRVNLFNSHFLNLTY